MVSNKEFDELNKKIRKTGLVMSSVPKNTRDEFVKFAEEEFADNYGACLKYVWDNFKLWKLFFENIDMKLNAIIDLIQNKQEPEVIKTLSGRKLKKE